MIRPTVNEVRAVSETLAAAYPSPGGNAALDALLNEAAPLASLLSGRLIGVTAGETPFGCPLEEVPTWMAPLALRAVATLTEFIRGRFSARSRRTVGGKELRSFSAGPYSESYFSPQEQVTSRRLVPDDAAHAALWAIATSCVMDYWNTLWGVGFPPPQAAVEEVTWFPEATTNRRPW